MKTKLCIPISYNDYFFSSSPCMLISIARAIISSSVSSSSPSASSSSGPADACTRRERIGDCRGCTWRDRLERGAVVPPPPPPPLLPYGLGTTGTGLGSLMLPAEVVVRMRRSAMTSGVSRRGAHGASETITWPATPRVRTDKEALQGATNIHKG